MDVCSAPSRVLLGFAGAYTTVLRVWIRNIFEIGFPGGRPSALASALLKLDRENELMPRSDLRRAQAHAVLSILGSDRSRLGPLFCTHPSTAARVARLEAIERRVQARPSAVYLDRGARILRP